MQYTGLGSVGDQYWLPAGALVKTVCLTWSADALTLRSPLEPPHCRDDKCKPPSRAAADRVDTTVHERHRRDVIEAELRNIAGEADLADALVKLGLLPSPQRAFWAADRAGLVLLR